MGLFDPSSWFKAPSMDMSALNGQYNQRLSQINDFSGKLNQYYNQYSNDLTNMYQHAFSNFTGNQAAVYGANGLGTNGGAFAAELARQATNYQSQMAPELAQFGVGNAQMIDSARSGAWGQMFGATQNAAQMKYQRQGEIDSSLGQMAFGALAAAGGAGMGMGAVSASGAAAPGMGFGGRFANMYMGQMGMGPMANPYRGLNLTGAQR